MKSQPSRTKILPLRGKSRAQVGANASTIAATIARLESSDAQERTRARLELGRLGRTATRFLIQVLCSNHSEARREAIGALADIADPAALEAFAYHLEDEDPVCRWGAARGLAALGEAGLERALRLLSQSPLTDEIASGTRHVLFTLERTGFADVVGPVLHAFDLDDCDVELPTAAQAALQALRNQRLARVF